MRPADTWKDYELLDATDGNRLERWGETLLVRPDPQVVWKTPQQSPDFTRGHWNDVKGFKHAFASPEDEAEAEKAAKEATAKLKEQGAKEWAAEK